MTDKLLNKKQLNRNTKVFISLITILIILLLIGGSLRPGTLQPTHLLEMFRQSIPLGIVAIGQSVVVLSGGIDLSVGEIITMTNILATDMMRGKSSSTLPVICFLLLLGGLIGGISGFIIAKIHVQPMVMTFAMASIVKGGYFLYSGGIPKGKVSEFLRLIGSGRIWEIPVSLFFYISFVAIVVFIFKKTKFGYSVFYIGNNIKAALYVGILVNKRLILVYSFSSITAVLTGLILSGYIGIGNFGIGGDTYMLNSIAASVIGGNTFNGIGSIYGTVLGALIIIVMNSLLTSIGMAETGRLIMRGLIILIMVTMYTRQTRNGLNIKLFNKKHQRDITKKVS